MTMMMIMLSDDNNPSEIPIVSWRSSLLTWNSSFRPSLKNVSRIASRMKKCTVSACSDYGYPAYSLSLRNLPKYPNEVSNKIKKMVMMMIMTMIMMMMVLWLNGIDLPKSQLVSWRIKFCWLEILPFVLLKNVSRIASRMKKCTVSACSEYG